jgi:hypothetical protein
MNRPSRASPNETRTTVSVAKLSPVRLELGAGPVDGSISLTSAWPKELFSRFVSPCTGRASAESSYVDAGYPAVFHTRSTMLVERWLDVTENSPSSETSQFIGQSPLQPDAGLV